jgi:nucleotide-binding universal stress UspA family protein
MKSILLHVQNDPGNDERLEAALSLARACSAHLHCLHATPIEAYVAFDAFGGVFVMSEVMRLLQEEEDALRERLRARLSREDVSWSLADETGHVASMLVRHAALADLIVTGRQPHAGGVTGSSLSQLGELLHGAKTPLYIPVAGPAPSSPTGIAAIAWNGGLEAAVAVRQSLGLLKLAASVQVLTVAEPGKSPAFPGTALLEYLSRHGIHSELRTLEAPGQDIAQTLVDECLTLEAAYLVMGGYGHSRMAEYLFGGVTRALLTEAPLPLVVAR